MDAEGSGPAAVTVSRAGQADIDALISLYHGFMLHESAQPPADDEMGRRLGRLLASDSDEVLIARVPDGEPAGYLQQRYYFSVWRPDLDAYIEDVFVVEELRGRRVGERLVEGAFEAAKLRGVGRISLDTNVNNRRGRRLYERLGFQTENAAWDGGQQLFYSRLL
jgi:ribosomal protein S18 acetylase RimI-like enzyme